MDKLCDKLDIHIYIIVHIPDTILLHILLYILLQSYQHNEDVYIQKDGLCIDRVPGNWFWSFLPSSS